jgi:hypothetical protein
MQSPRITGILRKEEEEKRRYGAFPFGNSCILARNLLAADAGMRFIREVGIFILTSMIRQKSQITTL